MKKTRKKSELRKVIDDVKYMTRQLNEPENPLPKIKIKKK